MADAPSATTTACAVSEVAPVPPLADGRLPDTTPDVASGSAPKAGYADEPADTSGIPTVDDGAIVPTAVDDVQSTREYCAPPDSPPLGAWKVG